MGLKVYPLPAVSELLTNILQREKLIKSDSFSLDYLKIGTEANQRGHMT